MKAASITIGTIYTNEKGRFRRVTAAGPQFKLYKTQSDLDNVQFVSTTTVQKGLVFDPGDYNEDGSYGDHNHCRYHNCTRASFARWAKREATADEIKTANPVLSPVKQTHGATPTKRGHWAFQKVE